MKLSALLIALFFVVSQGFSPHKSPYLLASTNGRYLQWSADKPFLSTINLKKNQPYENL